MDVNLIKLSFQKIFFYLQILKKKHILNETIKFFKKENERNKTIENQLKENIKNFQHLLDQKLTELRKDLDHKKKKKNLKKKIINKTKLKKKLFKQKLFDLIIKFKL